MNMQYIISSSPAQARHRPRPPHWQAVAARGHATDSARFYIFWNWNKNILLIFHVPFSSSAWLGNIGNYQVRGKKDPLNLKHKTFGLCNLEWIYVICHWCTIFQSCVIRFKINTYKSDNCLVCKSLRQSSCWILFKLLDLSKVLNCFLYDVTWICQNWYMDFSKFLHGFVKIDTESLCGFVKVATWIR